MTKVFEGEQVIEEDEIYALTFEVMTSSTDVAARTGLQV